MSAARTLGSLLAGIAPVVRDLELTDLTLDSRQVRPGGAFLACRGARHHGLDFAAEVAQRGAAAILYEPEVGRDLPAAGLALAQSQIVLTPVPGLAARASELAGRFFDEPSRALDVIGVTGTNGKTTCAWLLAQALGHCGLRSAYLGTLGTAVGGKLEPGELTTPDAVTVQRELARFRDAGASSAAIEVSSHALVQHRVAAAALRCGAVHEPDARPPRLPRRHGKLRRGQGAPVRLHGHPPSRLQCRRRVRRAACRQSGLCRAHRLHASRSRQRGGGRTAASRPRACSWAAAACASCSNRPSASRRSKRR